MIQKLGKVCRVKGGYAFKSTQFEDVGIPLVKIGNIVNNRVKIDDIYINKNDLNMYKDFIINTGDVLVALSGATTGKFGIYSNEEIALLNQRVAKIVPTEKINNRYLYHYMNKLQDIILETAKGAAQPNISTKEIEDLAIYVPDMPIQNRIADVLDKSQFLIDKRKEQIEACDELVKSRFIEMFGDPVLNPMNLPKVELGKLGDWKTGGTPSRSNNYYFNGNIPWLSSGELNNIYCFSSTEMITELAIKESSAKIIEIGSLLLGMYDTAALKSTINMIECSCNQAIAYAKLDENLVDTIYVYYCIQIGKDFYKSQQRGVRQKNLNLSMVKGLGILMPDLELQNQFAAFVKQVDKLKFEMQSSLKELEDNFNSLMQRAFNGELF
ncbi:MAG: restriction endonuclease subunit S [Romboutsia sp.]